MNKKNLYIAGGVALVGVIAYVIISKKKKKAALLKKEMEEQEAAEQLRLKMESEEKAEKDAKAKAEAEAKAEKEELAKCMRIGELRTTEQHQWIGLPYASREQASQIKIGSRIEIKNTDETLNGEYEVLDTWKDKNGNVGAVDVSHKLDLPKAVKGEKGDERFSGKGLICIINDTKD
jgi:hypothetical protein